MAETDEWFPEEYLFGGELLAPVKAASAALADRTGLTCEVGPRPSRSSEMQLVISPEAVNPERNRQADFPDRAYFTFALDCRLELMGKGSVTGDALRMEALQAHAQVMMALDSSFSVPMSIGIPDDNVPDNQEPADFPEKEVRISAERRGAGTFFETPDPESAAWEYSAEWLVTLRFEHSVKREGLAREQGGSHDNLSVEI